MVTAGSGAGADGRGRGAVDAPIRAGMVMFDGWRRGARTKAQGAVQGGEGCRARDRYFQQTAQGG